MQEVQEFTKDTLVTGLTTRSETLQGQIDEATALNQRAIDIRKEVDQFQGHGDSGIQDEGPLAGDIASLEACKEQVDSKLDAIQAIAGQTVKLTISEAQGIQDLCK